MPCTLCVYTVDLSRYSCKRNFIFKQETAAYILCFISTKVNTRRAKKKTNGKLIQTLGRKIKGPAANNGWHSLLRSYSSRVSTVSLTLPRMYCRSRYEVSSPMSGRERKLRLTRKAFLYRETGGPLLPSRRKRSFAETISSFHGV